MAEAITVFKHEKQGTTLMFLHPLVVMVMFDMSDWCYKRNIQFVVTDTISTVKKDVRLGRKSDAHRTFRAFDLRSRTFSEEQLREFIKHFSEKYEGIAAISYSDYMPRLIVHHGEGDNEHLHVSIHSRYSIKY